MYLLSLREAGDGVNCAIARASATGIIRRKQQLVSLQWRTHFVDKGLKPIFAREDELHQEEG